MRCGEIQKQRIEKESVRVLGYGSGVTLKVPCAPK